ncbi:MAG TPA: alpha/beta hydrolase [Mycobacteriales bacterium]|nr:alpha/beta hydrolase [Mycobacteriales bacterium]
MSERARQWHDRGSYFSWTPSEEGASPVEVFHVETGDPANPPLLLVHGFPTCSVDWMALVDLLSDRYYVCALDFPGYGFSDKPRHWGYRLGRDAALLDHYLAEVVHRDAAIVVSHDRGTSVSLLHTIESAAGRTRTTVEHLVLTNGNIFLPLSNLTDFQRMILHPDSAAAVLEVVTAEMLAAGMGQATFSPPRDATDQEIAALAATFAYADGMQVLPETVQYLVERSDHETEWLEALARTDVPTTVVWGMNDTVAPPRVPLHSWDDFLMLKPGRNRIYLVPDAGHYLQNDRPDALAAVLRHSFDADSDGAAGPLEHVPGSPVLIDCSRPHMPASRDVLAGAAGG